MKQASKRQTRVTAAMVRVRSAAGFTLTEALATVIIVGLVTSMLAGGIALAVRHYTQSMAASQSQMLCSTLQQIIDTDLRYTSTVYLSDSNEDGTFKVVGYSSKSFRVQGDVATPFLRSLDDENKPRDINSYGQLALCASQNPTETAVSRILGTGSYNYGLRAKIEDFRFDSSKRLFKLTLCVGRPSDDKPLETQTFTVNALNIQVEKHKGEY